MAMAAATRPPFEEDEETSGEEPEEEDVYSESEGDKEKPHIQSYQKFQTSSESSESDSKSAGSTIKSLLKPTLLLQKSPESYSKSSSKHAKSIAVKEGEKKSGGRLWTDDDQVALLQGMIQFKSQRGADPLAKMADFYEFLKERLDFAYSKSQVQEKIRRLKKKLMKKGETSTSNPADSKIFQLSQQFWGLEGRSGKNLEASSGKGKSLVDLKNKIVESSSAVEKSKEKRKKAPKDEEIGARKKMKKEIEKEERTTSKRKDNEAAAGGKDDKTIAEKIGIQATTDEGGNVANGVVQGEMEKREDFGSKYHHFLNSLSVKYYPLTPEETLCEWKEKALLLDCSVAEKVEMKWAKVWEEYDKLGKMVADLVSLQARLVRGEEVTF